MTDPRDSGHLGAGTDRASPGGMPLWHDEPLLHPACWSGIALLALNDHVLKAAVPGLVTGKLSDLAGMVFFPLLLERLPLPAGRSTRRRLAVAATVLGFTFVKATALGTALWNDAYSALYRLLGVADGSALVNDSTDLVALPLALVAFLLPLPEDP